MQKKIFILIGAGTLIILFFIIGASGSGKKTATVNTTPTSRQTNTIHSTVAENVEPSAKITLTQEQRNQIVEVDLDDDMIITLDYASTVEGAKLYRKIGYLVNGKKMNGIPFMENTSDPQVDANPESDSVQLGMIYEYEGSLTSEIKQQILSDFRKIKELAEDDRSLVLPEAGGLRLLVLTFHDKKGKARGELEQLYIDAEPNWSEWK